MGNEESSEQIDYSKDYRPAPQDGAIRVFPPYLNVNSEGYAVESLWRVLAYLGFWDYLVHAGVPKYAQGTEVAVRKLQEWLGFEGVDVDGNFGPGTRARLRAKTGIDVDRAVSSSVLLEERKTYWEAPDGVIRVWPPEGGAA